QSPFWSRTLSAVRPRAPSSLSARHTRAPSRARATAIALPKPPPALRISARLCAIRRSTFLSGYLSATPASKLVAHEFSRLHDDGHARLVAELAQILERVEIQDEQVGMSTGGDHSNLALKLQKLRIDRRCRAEHVDRLVYPGAQLELPAMPWVRLIVEQIGPQSQFDAVPTTDFDGSQRCIAQRSTLLRHGG